MPSHANPVNWFEIPVTDLKRAVTFYSTVLGVSIHETEMGPNLMGWFSMDMETKGATGALIKADGYTPSGEGSLVYLHVDAIDPTLEAISANGGETLMPTTSPGEHAFIAHFIDPEDSHVALHASPAT